MPRCRVGLELRGQSLAAVKVRGGLRRMTLEDWVSVPLPEGEGTAPLEAALQQVDERLGLAQTACVVGLPPEWMCFRLVPVPFRDPRKIRQILPFEMELKVPGKVEEMTFGHLLLELPAETGGLTALAAGLPAARLEHLLQTLRRHQAQPAAVTVSGHAAAAWLGARPEAAGSGLLLDLDPTRAALHVFDQGRPPLIRVWPRPLQGNPEAAALERAIRFTLTAFGDRHGLTPAAEPLWLTGPDAGPTALLAADPLDLRTRAGIGTPDGADDPWIPALFDGPLALVLAEAEDVSLLRFPGRSFAFERLWQQHRRPLVRCGVLALLVGALFVGQAAVTYRHQRQTLDHLEHAAADIFQESFPDARRVVDPLAQMRTALAELKSGSGLAFAGIGGPTKSEILAEMSRRVDPRLEVEVARLIMGEVGVTMDGTVADFNQVNTLKTSLEGIPFFGKVIIDAATIDSESRQVRFQITAELRP